MNALRIVAHNALALLEEGKTPVLDNKGGPDDGTPVYDALCAEYYGPLDWADRRPRRLPASMYEEAQPRDARGRFARRWRSW